MGAHQRADATGLIPTMGTEPPLPRVLLIEDDASIRHFVQAALEDRRVNLHPCACLADARQALAEAAPVLVLLDLMLPDGSGLSLLEDSVARANGGAAKWVVFSAGLSPAVAARLPQLGVSQVLVKPVGLCALLACVDGALAAQAQAPRSLQPKAHSPATAAAVSTATSSTPTAPPGVRAVTAMPPEGLLSDDGSPDALARAIALYFEGDTGLFRQMRDRAHSLFRQDLQAAEQALQRQDTTALRRIVHTLKTVLRMLGHPAASAIAYQLEEALVAGREDAARQLWPTLRSRVERAASSG